MDLLALLIIVFLSPLLLILLVERGGPWLHWLADHLESSGWLRVLSALSHVGIVFAVVIFILDWPVRQQTLEAFKEEAEDRKAGAEGRAWSLIYQAEGSTGDGGRRHALQYLHNEKKANLAGLPLANAYLIGVNLPKARLVKADLRGAELRGADLREAYLYGADLSEADLSEANLRGANLRGANLRGANLYGVKLYGADLGEADLRKAILSGADLREADTLMQKHIQKQLNNAYSCQGWLPPQLPAELKPPPVRKCDNYGKPIEE